MSERGRLVALTVALALAIGVTALAAAQRIESRLLTRTQAALAAEGIAFYDLEIDGRDLRFDGVASSSEASRIAAVAADVPGVRSVRAVPDDSRLDAPPPIAGLAEPASLRIDRRSGTVQVDGVVSPAAARALREAIGSLGLVGDDRLIVDERATGALGPDTARTLVGLLRSMDEPARITLRGDAVTLSGVVPDESAERQLRTTAATLGELRWSFELFVADEGAG